MICLDHQPDTARLGYLAWHDKAHTTYAKGARQRQCTECVRWFFPWEMRKP